MTAPQQSMAELAARTIDIYDRNAARYDAERPRVLFERGWLERFAAPLPAHARVLDLGCGAGEPIGRWLRERGFRVTGVDAAPAMLAVARARAPEGDWREADMRRLALSERFDGIVAWDSFFHLTAEEQRAALPLIASHLAPGGWLMLTVGPDHGVETGVVCGETVHHASLSSSEYAALLEAAGVRLVRFVAEDPECDMHSVLLARRDAEPSAIGSDGAMRST